MGENGFETRYRDRLKVALTIEPDHETLADIYRRALAAWEPRAVPGSDGYVDDPFDAVHWAWFYEASDEHELADKTWEVAEHLVTRRERLSKAVEAADVVARYHETWTPRGAGPPEILATLDRIPWQPDDLRALLGLATVEEATTPLEGFGFAAGTDGLYSLSENEEARLLHQIADEASRGALDESERRAEDRLKAALETGSLPPWSPWDEPPAEL